MPIDTDSEQWKSGEEESSEQTILLSFLKSNSGKAYNIHEVTKEVYDMDWDNPGPGYYRETDLMEMSLDNLVDKGLVQIRRVDSDSFQPEIPSEQDTILAYTYSGTQE